MNYSQTLLRAFDTINSALKVRSFENFETQHLTLDTDTDTTVTFAHRVTMVRITNWDEANVVLVKNGSIADNTDSTASRVGIAAATNIPNSEIYPISTTTIHLMSAGASAVTVEGFR